MYKYWKIFWQFRKLSLMYLAAYRGDAFFWTIVNVMWTAFNFFFYGILISINNGVAGWSVWELYLLISIFTILGAFIWSFFSNNMSEYTRLIYNGELSLFMLKPVNLQFLLMTQKNSYNNLTRLIISAFVLVISLIKLGVTPSILQILLFLILLTCSLLFLYFLWFIFATFSFYVEKLENINHLIPSLQEVWRMPRYIYSGLVSTIFTVILPLGLVSTVPAEVILGKAELFTVLYLPLATMIVAIISHYCLQFSIRKYQGIGG